MTTLVSIDGSQSSREAMMYAMRSRPAADLLLVYVSPSARQGELQRGEFLLKEGRRACEELDPGAHVHTRLEVGDLRTLIPQIAARSNCDLVVMGAYGVNALPHVEPLGSDVENLPATLHRTLVMVMPTGERISCGANGTADEEE